MNPTPPNTKQRAVVAGFSLVEVALAAINGYRAEQAASLKIAGRAPVPLEGAPETEFVVFRGGEGLRDQVAIVVSKPDLDSAVPVRDRLRLQLRRDHALVRG